jgi:hypothetical protein
VILATGNSAGATAMVVDPTAAAVEIVMIKADDRIAETGAIAQSDRSMVPERFARMRWNPRSNPPTVWIRIFRALP